MKNIGSGSLSSRLLGGAAILACLGAFGSGATGVLSSTAAAAAEGDLQQFQGVRERARPEYDALGLRLGSFMVYPTLDISVGYNDNIFAAETDEEEDTIFGVTPTLRGESTWSRHSLGFRLSLPSEFYSDNGGEDNTQFESEVNGQIDVTRATSIGWRAFYNDLEEDRSATNTARTKDPIEYESYGFGLGLRHAVGRLVLEIGGDYTELDYEDGRLVGGGISEQDVRDRSILAGTAKVSFAVSPDTSVFIRGGYNDRDYDLEPPQSFFDRDSDGYEIAVGSSFKITRLIEGEVYVGYQEQFYDDDPSLNDVDGLDYGIGVNWYVTQLTTVKLYGDSSIQDSTVAGSSGFLSDTVGISVDHELLRNLLLGAKLSHTWDDFEGVNREDETLRLQLSADYFVNRNLGLFAKYEYADRDSNTATNSYDQNVIMVGARLQQ